MGDSPESRPIGDDFWAADGSLSAQLNAVLGRAHFVQLCEVTGGTRLYVPLKPSDENIIVRTLGHEAAGKLAAAFAPGTIRVPLARQARAEFYRESGLSNARIARKLGITENAVTRLFKRAAKQGAGR